MNKYTVRLVNCKTAKEYIHTHHYSHGSHNGPSPCYGLFDVEGMIGCCMFATPCSENVRSSLWGAENKNRVIELHRLHILDCTPKNTETFFISQCLGQLKSDRPELWGVITFADTTQGHTGTIYKASNAYRLGSTGDAWFYLDENGRLRHPRQAGVNISLNAATIKGWSRVRRKAKNRYLWLLPDDKRHKKWLVKNCKYDLSAQKFH